MLKNSVAGEQKTLSAISSDNQQSFSRLHQQSFSGLHTLKKERLSRVLFRTSQSSLSVTWCNRKPTVYYHLVLKSFCCIQRKPSYSTCISTIPDIVFQLHKKVLMYVKLQLVLMSSYHAQPMH